MAKNVKGKDGCPRCEGVGEKHIPFCPERAKFQIEKERLFELVCSYVKSGRQDAANIICEAAQVLEEYNSVCDMLAREQGFYD